MFAYIYEAASHMTHCRYTYPVYTCQDKASRDSAGRRIHPCSRTRDACILPVFAHQPMAPPTSPAAAAAAPLPLPLTAAAAQLSIDLCLWKNALQPYTPEGRL